MTEDRKYFGMTSKQIAILAGLAVAFLLLLVVGAWLVLGGGLGRKAAPQNTPVPQSTVTPYVIPTASPTETLTPVPYEMLIPEDWVQYKTALVEIWLPKGFKTASTEVFDRSANLAVPELFMMETSSKTSLYNMLVVVSYEPLVGDSLDAYLTSEIAKLPMESRVGQRSNVSVNSQNVIRLLIEMRRDNIDITDLVYVFLDGTTVWYVEYAAQINEFFEMRDMFETSVKTFRIVR